MPDKPRIALLFGGTSPERIISKRSAASVYSAIKNLGYNCKLINPAYGEFQPEKTEVFFMDEDPVEISNRNYVKAINSELLDDIDLAFIVLHGKWGEDGTIQSLLELRGIKYTGSRVLSSSISIDKDMSKILFLHYGVQTAKWFSIDKNYDNGSIIKTIEDQFGFPAVVKPNDQGSTVGLSICENSSQVEEALKLSFQYSDKVIIEEYIPGREMTVAILDNKALPVLEIKPKHGIYDYECKYTTGMSEYIVPAEIPKEAAERLQSQAMLAFNALGCQTFGRIDFRMDNNFEPFCLEANTLPGLTSTSLVPKMAKAVGISFEQLVDRIIRLSL
ncbi:MAG TPA: D-alanine--D-alanine ligase [Ignavibacteriaceae bacterium]|nr:D-alanine--D-alanine ligase [Ignavibacteriaceae bacterium]